MFIARVMQNFSHGSTHWCCILIFVMVLSVIWPFIVMIITLSSQLESRVPGLWQYTLFFLINTQNFEITAKLFNKLTKIVPQNFSSLIWSIFWEYYFTQTNNYKRYKRLKLYYIFTILKTHFTINISVLQVLPDSHVSKFQSFCTHYWVLSQVFNKTKL